MSLCAWSYNVPPPAVRFMQLPAIPVEKKRRTLPEMLTAIANAFDVTVAGLKSPQRHRSIAYPRFAAFLLLHDERKLTLAQIGRHLGDRDHSTVFSGIARARKLLVENAEFAARYDEARGL